MSTAALVFTPRIRLSLMSDDPEVLNDLLEKVHFEECMKGEPVDYILPDEGAADMFQCVRSEFKSAGRATTMTTTNMNGPWGFIRKKGDAVLSEPVVGLTRPSLEKASLFHRKPREMSTLLRA